MTFNVEVKDPDAPVDFYIGGKKVIPGQDDRVQVRVLDNGQHQLIINKIAMSDDGVIEARTPSNYSEGDKVVSSCSFSVAKGEDRPEMGSVPPVTGIANKNCSWKIPYEVKRV
jgi:hypothetical protein